ncbi:hypothetical protein JM16_008852 [Phytophthora kernoviae]|uniref:Amino acid transporter transmembrane domain-containing protein n=1 Tax=Phytophthora kernoviae TaxID=325452 RepID=A0A8T0LKQ0_9STRA|nr:hypothetical protein JM16_008852 [Phytophthora kernoviae]
MHVWMNIRQGDGDDPRSSLRISYQNVSVSYPRLRYPFELYWIGFMALLCLPMCLIPMLKEGARVAFAGCTGTITADVIRAAVIMYGMRSHPSVPPSQLIFEQFAGMFGSLSLAYNAGIVIPSLQRQHSDPSRIPRVVFATTGFISCLFLILASTVYSAVGCQVTGNLLYSIYPDSSTGKDHIINDDRRSSKVSCISNADAENPYNGDFETEAAEYRGANAFKYIVFRITMIVYKMKVTKVFFVALAALCLALHTATAAPQPRNLRQNSEAAAEFAAKPADDSGRTRLQDSTNPLKRRDQALVSAHRVYDPVSGLACSLVGGCMACPQSEQDESYCRETGYRQELDCPRPRDPKADSLLTKPEDERQTRFKACSPEDTSRPGVVVVKFELAMTVLLAVSVLLLRRERRNHMSSFDLRKDPRQRTGLLGGGSDKSSD